MLRLISRNGTDALPVSMAEMAQHLKREDTVEDDDYINACLLAAIDWAERFTGMVMIDSTYDLFIDNFPATFAPMTSIPLRRAPLLEVISVNYRDGSSVDTTLGTTGYGIDYAGSTIYLPAATTWPSTDGASNAVSVRFRAGFVDYDAYPPAEGDIPDTLKAAIKLFAAYLYGNRDNEQNGTPTRIPYGAEMLLRLHRIDDSLA